MLQSLLNGEGKGDEQPFLVGPFYGVAFSHHDVAAVEFLLTAMRRVVEEQFQFCIADHIQKLGQESADFARVLVPT